MGEVLVTPDVEAAVVTYLRAKLGSLADKVATKVPATMPARMVRVSLTGGSRDNVIMDQVQLTVECWATASDVEASNLARVAQAHMYAANGSSVGAVWVRRVDSVGGVQFFPDPDTNAPRYQFTVRWHVRPASI
jgi:metal-dependent amidase/aminoacylase/carboxypeptidase family protein